MKSREPSIGSGRTFNIAVSVGGTKIGTAAVDGDGTIATPIREVPTPRTRNHVYRAIAAQAAVVAAEVGLRNIAALGISFPECIPPPRRLMGDPDGDAAQKSDIQLGIEREVRREIGVSLPVEVLHDAAAAVLGEISAKGTFPSCGDVVFIVWGTGVASGIVRRGNLYWKDPEIGTMTGEIGLLTVRNRAGVYEYRPSARREAVVQPEETLDRRHCGPAIIGRMREEMRRDAGGGSLEGAIGKPAGMIDLRDINRAAREGSEYAAELIARAGREMGEALVPFIRYWRLERGMGFTDRMIIGSGVAKLGDGVVRNGRAVLIEAIRDGIRAEWDKLSAPGYDAQNVVLSRIGYEREFYAFLPAG